MKSVVVKRQGRKESFDERKVYGSVYAACASAQYSERSCERTSAEITKNVKAFVKKRPAVDSSAIRKKVIAELKKKGKELAFFYEQHIPNLKKL